MKHLLLIILTLVFAEFIFSQKVDTITNYKKQGNSWLQDSRDIYAYNSACLDTVILKQVWKASSSSWETRIRSNIYYDENNRVYNVIDQDASGQNRTQTFYSYNENDQMTSLLQQMWFVGFDWVNYFWETWTFNNNGTINRHLLREWHQYIGWQNTSQETYFYNPDSTTKQMIVEDWVSGLLSYKSRYTYSYNINKTISETKIEDFNFVASKWVNLELYAYSYNGDKTAKESVKSVWDTVTPGWVNRLRHAFTYNAAQSQETDTTLIWKNNQWKDSFLLVYTYNANNQITYSLSQLWDTLSSSWKIVSHYSKTYNSDGTIAEYRSNLFDEGNPDDTYRTTYHYFTSCALPLTLFNFTATFNGKAAYLQWTTITEINTKNFVVQRSTDGTRFSSLGVVNAMGNSTQRTSYKFIDEGAVNAEANKLYYRLQMIDKDGKFTYSKIAIIEIANDRTFVIYPNPVKDLLLIKTNSSLNSTEIRISDQNGKIVLKQIAANMQEGMSNKINVANLKKGVYYLQLITGNDVQTAKFFKY